MRSSFFGLNVALSGLYTAQRNLDTINHNLSNASTPGYSRQQAVQQASLAIGLYNGTGMVGTGSEVLTVERIHDDYLDYKYWSGNTASGEWSVKQDMLSEIEKTFNEPSTNGSGFNKIMDDFYKSMDDLSRNPSDLSARKVVISKGVSLTKYYNSLATHFEKIQSDTNDAVRIKVDEINSLAVQLQNLNKQIYTAEADGNTANDMRDKRGVLVDQLSKIVDIQANEVTVGKLVNGRDNKHFVITVDGKALIDHFNISKLRITQRATKLNEEDINNLYEIDWADGNNLEINGGELKGYLDIRDGNGQASSDPDKMIEFKGIPYYTKKANEFVRKLALAINEGITEGVGSDGVTKIYTKSDEYTGHANGFGLEKPGTGVSSTEIRFFAMTGWSSSNNRTTELDSNEFINDTILAGLDADPVKATGMLYENLTAKNFSVSGDLINQEYGEYNLAASAGAGLPEDNSNLLQFLDMRHDTHMFTEGAPEDFMKAMVASLGIDSQQSMQINKTQETIMEQIENRRASISGVSLNEEMVNLVKYQHAYNAAAKMISTMSEIYDTLINRVGV